MKLVKPGVVRRVRSIRPMLAVWALSGMLAALQLAGLSGCATPAPTATTDEVEFDQAAASATDSLIAQTQKLPAFLTKLTSNLAPGRALVVDPMLESGPDQQTALTRRLEETVTGRLRAQQPPFEVLAFQQASLPKAQYLLIGTLTRLPAAADAKAGGKRSPFQINLALIDLKTGTVAAQASTRARDDQLDTTPSAYYRESPVLVKDKVIDGYVRTSQTPPGQPADSAYFGSLSAAMSINEATQAFNASQYERSLGLYKSALETPGGEQLRSLNGIYLASWKLGNAVEAEAAFGKVVALGIAGHSLGVKILFNPNSTDFWSDARVSGPYTLWLRQIARQAAASKVCMDIIGHTSHTGSESYNDRLSEQRAAMIRQKLGAEAPELTARTKARGMGFRQNLIGTGTDDASDALDRRVEFAIQPC